MSKKKMIKEGEWLPINNDFDLPKLGTKALFRLSNGEEIVGLRVMHGNQRSLISYKNCNYGWGNFTHWKPIETNVNHCLNCEIAEDEIKRLKTEIVQLKAKLCEKNFLGI